MTDLPPLFRRLLWAKQNLRPVQPKYRIVWEDPNDPDAPVKVTSPAPEWLACALHGGILPPVDAHVFDKRIEAQFEGKNFNWHDVGGATHPYAEPIGPMTEEEAMEYLVMKDLPEHVWTSNWPRFKIVRADMVPTNRVFRNAWEMEHAEA